MDDIDYGTLNTTQIEAAKKIEYWFNHETSIKQTFSLAGYAGTGKTYLINFVIKNLLKLDEVDVAFLTPTGKAASVLIQRGRDATTIHHLIYQVVEKKVKIGDKIMKKICFAKRKIIPKYKLIVLDEASMVEKDILNDLLSFGIPVLCSGDSGQLPPIFGSNGLLDSPDVTLSEIVRQEADSPIVILATMARYNQYIPFGSYGDALVLDKRFLTNEKKLLLYKKADQILCGTNKTRVNINNLIREDKGFSGKCPQQGEKIICLVNDWRIYLDNEERYNLVNGTIGYIDKYIPFKGNQDIAQLNFNPDFLPNIVCENILVDSGIFRNGIPSYDMRQVVFKLADGTYSIKKGLLKSKDSDMTSYLKEVAEELKASNSAIEKQQLEQFDYAYAISVHKSQGSEWDKVVVVDESEKFGKNASKWLYTAITRAKQKLVIIR